VIAFRDDDGGVSGRVYWWNRLELILWRCISASTYVPVGLPPQALITMVLQETVLCATAPQPSGSGPGAFVLHDLQTGTTLASFRQTSSAPHCTAFVETANGQGGIMFGAQMDKSVLNIYNFQRVSTKNIEICCLLNLLNRTKLR